MARDLWIINKKMDSRNFRSKFGMALDACVTRACHTDIAEMKKKIKIKTFYIMMA
jgi:hypothetical protein